MGGEHDLNRRQLAAKIEATPGTAETLAASDADLEIYDVRYLSEPELHERRPANAYHGKLPSVPGKKAGGVTFRAPLKGSGNVATAPSIGKLLRACGMREVAGGEIDIGAVSGGPFQAGERVTGGMSSAVGVVLKDTADGASVLPIAVVSGTFQNAETLTGAESSASATSGSTVTGSKGFAYFPLTDAIPTLTLGVYGDAAKRKTIEGARGTFTLSADAGGICWIEFTFRGADLGETAVAMLSGISYETTDPPVMLDASATILGFGAAVYSSFGFDRANTLTDAGGNANDALGIDFVRIVAPSPTITVNPLAELEATQGFDTKLRAGTLARFCVEFPGTAGNDCVFSAIKAQAMTKGEGDQEGIETAELGLDVVRADLNSQPDEHFLISVL